MTKKKEISKKNADNLDELIKNGHVTINNGGEQELTDLVTEDSRFKKYSLIYSYLNDKVVINLAGFVKDDAAATETKEAE